MLFDLETDPDALADLGNSQAPDHIAVRERLSGALLNWSRRDHTRITGTPDVLARQSKAAEGGILIGFWDEEEYEAETGKAFSSLAPLGPPDK